MITNFENYPEIKVENLRNGDGIVYIRKMTDLPPHVIMYAKITIPSFSSIGYHIHIDDTETIYCLKGKGNLITEEGLHELTEGSINYVAPNKSHSIENKNNEDLVLLAIIVEK